MRPQSQNETNLNAIFSDSHFVSKPIAEQVVSLMTSFSEVAQKNGYSVKAFSPGTQTQFMGLSAEKLGEIYLQFSAFYRIFGEALDQGKKVSDSKSVLWSLLKEMKLRPASDIFDKIADDDVVEAYGLDFRQIFRNLRFFDFCSYSLAEIFMYEWRDLFERDQKINQSLAELATGILSGESPKTISVNIGWHLMQETFSADRVRFNINHKFLSPLFDQNNQIAALLAISEAHLLDKRSGASLSPSSGVDRADLLVGGA